MCPRMTHDPTHLIPFLCCVLRRMFFYLKTPPLTQTLHTSSHSQTTTVSIPISVFARPRMMPWQPSKLGRLMQRKRLASLLGFYAWMEAVNTPQMPWPNKVSNVRPQMLTPLKRTESLNE